MTKNEYRQHVMKRMLRRAEYREAQKYGPMKQRGYGTVVIVDWSKRKRGPGAFDWLTEGPVLR